MSSFSSKGAHSLESGLIFQRVSVLFCNDLPKRPAEAPAGGVATARAPGEGWLASDWVEQALSAGGWVESAARLGLLSGLVRAGAQWLTDPASSDAAGALGVLGLDPASLSDCTLDLGAELLAASLAEPAAGSAAAAASWLSYEEGAAANLTAFRGAWAAFMLSLIHI